MDGGLGAAKICPRQRHATLVLLLALQGQPSVTPQGVHHHLILLPQCLGSFVRVISRVKSQLTNTIYQEDMEAASMRLSQHFPTILSFAVNNLVGALRQSTGRQVTDDGWLITVGSGPRIFRT